MPDKVFLDTNILIYGYFQDEPDKQQRAIECVQSGDVWISTQVLNETINVLRRKFSFILKKIIETSDRTSFWQKGDRSF